MNMLIVGGLLIFALLAILGVVWLALSEQKASQTKTATIVAPTPPQKKIVPTSKERTNSQNLPVPRQTTAPIAMKEQNAPILDGQFHEFAAEVRSLHLDAIQLEQRLAILEEMIDQIEHTRTGHVSVEEELNPIS